MRLTYDLSNYEKSSWEAFYRKCLFIPHRLAELSSPSLAHPIYIRTGTSDINNVVQILMREEYRFARSTVSSMLDLGAYIGLSSIYIASNNPNARILACEPDPASYHLALLNTAPYPNIKVLHAGVSISNGYLACTSSHATNLWGNRYRPVGTELSLDHTRELPIRGFDIPTMLSYFPGATVDFLKIDIEGYERELFLDPNAAKWISRAICVSCELHDKDQPGCSASFHNAFNGLNYTLSQCGEFKYYTKNT